MKLGIGDIWLGDGYIEIRGLEGGMVEISGLEVYPSYSFISMKNLLEKYKLVEVMAGQRWRSKYGEGEIEVEWVDGMVGTYWYRYGRSYEISKRDLVRDYSLCKDETNGC